jgi:cytochrome c-type biogenesis protein CcmH
LAIGLYLKLGAQSEAFAPKSISHPEMAVASTLNPETKIASVDALVKRLARRLESSPDDADGWVLLGRSYDHLKRYEEASAAYARARALGIDSADLISGEANVQSAAQTKALRASPLAIAGDGNQMLMNLLQRVDADPGDVDGWALLGRSYQALGQYADASEAFERATTLAPNNPQLWADYADALATTQGKQLAGRPMELVQKSLQLDPNQPKALWLAGTAAMQGRDSSSAIEYWERLQKLLPAGSEDARVIGRNIAGIEASSIGIANTLVDRTATVPPANPTGSVRQIRGVVSLDPKLAEQVSDTDTVFVFARAAEGPRVPLAVVRKRAKDLPISFVLDDDAARHESLKV